MVFYNIINYPFQMYHSYLQNHEASPAETAGRDHESTLDWMVKIYPTGFEFMSASSFVP